MLSGKRCRIYIITATLITLLALTALAAGPAWAGKWKRQSQEHEDACNQWCDNHKPECTHCSTLRDCGAGYDGIQSWTGYGKNWHACKKRLSGDELVAQGWRDCRAWCQENSGACQGCRGRCESMHGLTSVKRWGDRGRYIHACGKKHYSDPASNYNRDGCFRYCDQSSLRCSCSANKHCGQHRVAIRSWKGKGKNFHACASRKSIKAWNKTNCEAWCAERPDTCLGCKTNKNCGSGQSNLKTFGLGNNSLLDYHACQKKQSRGGTLSTAD